MNDNSIYFNIFHNLDEMNKFMKKLTKMTQEELENVKSPTKVT